VEWSPRSLRGKKPFETPTLIRVSIDGLPSLWISRSVPFGPQITSVCSDAFSDAGV